MLHCHSLTVHLSSQASRVVQRSSATCVTRTILDNRWREAAPHCSLVDTAASTGHSDSRTPAGSRPLQGLNRRIGKDAWSGHAMHLAHTRLNPAWRGFNAFFRIAEEPGIVASSSSLLGATDESLSIEKWASSPGQLTLRPSPQRPQVEMRGLWRK